MANKKERIATLIQKNISDIIMFDMKDPVMRLVSVNSCDVTNDYSYCKVYVSHLDLKKVDLAVEQLNKAKGFIRSELAHRMDIYKVPEITFIKDDTYDKGERIEEVLRELNNK
jgi:ribosome-binding factor A